ncbi:hypothetical protein EDM68_05425 [Candidatus Uhrbacteria bacterium]|nr:MAG: hypothetical protein EDM68_05425 [Candidatus Uhrbacteria bacterium]
MQKESAEILFLLFFLTPLPFVFVSILALSVFLFVVGEDVFRKHENLIGFFSAMILFAFVAALGLLVWFINYNLSLQPGRA